MKKAAQNILDVRAKYFDCRFADMHGEQMYLFSTLVTAHQKNEKAVMLAYGFWSKLNSEERVCGGVDEDVSKDDGGKMKCL